MNALFIIANLVDVGYFPFTRKRSTYDLLEQIGGQTDLKQLLPQFIKDFWWIPIFFILFIVGLIFLYNRVACAEVKLTARSKPKDWIVVGLLFLLTTGFSVLAVRGGLQRIPIDIVNAGSVTAPEEIPIVLNTPFTLIKSVGRQSLEEVNYFTEAELKKLFNPVHHFSDSTLRKQNVVVLILESFSKEYTGLGNRKSITPFLDSLMSRSLVFTNAFSNGTKSIEGIPAIISSIPTFMENPFINSVYANNLQTTFASLLKDEGYATAFFHGGINGTMNFDDWSATAGYKQYFGKNEYNNDEDFDNFWGIWDEPFLQYAVKKMMDLPEPFHTAIFTLSSHHPYFVPAKYKNKFAKGRLENSESVAYADYALRRFFETAKKTKWFKNTLFVLSADHASISSDPFYSNVVGNQSIPILFYKPDNSLIGEYPKNFSQIDILPSVMQQIGYNKPFFAFGKSYLSKAHDPSYYYGGGMCYCYTDSMLFSISENKLHTAINYQRDSTLSINLVFQYPETDSSIMRQYKAIIQTYNNTLIKNSGRLK